MRETVNIFVMRDPMGTFRSRPRLQGLRTAQCQTRRLRCPRNLGQLIACLLHLQIKALRLESSSTNSIRVLLSQVPS